MADYKTPGVYVEEITTLPPSAGQVPTAIPAFIGYTQRAEKNGKSLINSPTMIKSMLEYRAMFGGQYNPESITVTLDSPSIQSVEFIKKFYLYNSVRMFFANGGGQCYIVSIGSYADEVDMDKLLAGIDAVAKEDIPTILVAPDAMLLEKKDQCYSVQQQMLAQCAKLQDRVAVLDIFDGFIDRSDEDVVTNFRSGIGVNHLKYGASYYPWIQTTFTTEFGFENIILKDADGGDLDIEKLVTDPTAIKHLKEVISDGKIIFAAVESPYGADVSLTDKFFKIEEDAVNTKAELTHYLTIIKELANKLIELKANEDIINVSIKNELSSKTNSSSVLANIIKAAAAIDVAAGTAVFNIESDFVDFDLPKVKPSQILTADEDEKSIIQKTKGIMKGQFENMISLLQAVKSDVLSIQEHYDKVVYDTNTLYKSIVNEIHKEGSKLPPSGAIAGIYAQVDFAKGVWKAPANVSLASTVKPWIKIDNDQQEDLNVDLNGGKSVNAIRAFVGQGTLIWGARTLAGNDNEWRYISVRRFFNMVEKSLKLATNWAVFEANDTSTWIRVKAMIDNFLTNLWKAGALTGSSPAEAFFCNVGLGSTMTQVDILEGRMNIEIGLAAVRPAEFIILKFSHKFDVS